MSTMLNFRRSALTTQLLLTVACGTMRVSSNPEGATISFQDQAGKASKLGITPLVMPIKEFDKATNGRAVSLVIEKTGFAPVYVGVPETANANFQIDVPLMPAKECKPHDVNEILTLVLQTEKLIAEEKFEEALAAVGKIKELDGDIGAAFQLEGTIYLLTKKFDLSRLAWTEALRLTPKNKDIQRALELVDRKMKETGVSPTKR
jgi:tetratricopeptide (TPR) repeat protein